MPASRERFFGIPMTNRACFAPCVSLAFFALAAVAVSFTGSAVKRPSPRAPDRTHRRSPEA